MSVRIVAARSGKGWEYDIRFVWPEGGRLRERGKCPASAKETSKRWAEARERSIFLDGKANYRPLRSPTPSGGLTFGAFWPRVVTDHYKANRKKASTLKAAQSIVDCHLLPMFGTTPLAEITTAEVQSLKGALAERGPKTVNNVLSVLSRALRCAVEWEVLPVLPCRFGLLKVADVERDWYELPEYRRLVEGARKMGPREHILVLLAGSAGLRRGEIIALKWSDIDIERRTVRVERAVWHDRKDVSTEATPKGGRSRPIPIQLVPELVDALRAFRHLDDRVLPNPDGRDLTYKTIRCWMKRAQRRAGLPVTGGIHMLRHTFCSHLAIAGANVKAIQELAGHADLKTTQRYMHLSPGNRNDAMTALATMQASDTSETRTPQRLPDRSSRRTAADRS